MLKNNTETKNIETEMRRSVNQMLQRCALWGVHIAGIAPCLHAVQFMSAMGFTGQHQPERNVKALDPIAQPRAADIIGASHREHLRSAAMQLSACTSIPHEDSDGAQKLTYGFRRVVLRVTKSKETPQGQRQLTHSRHVAITDFRCSREYGILKQTRLCVEQQGTGFARQCRTLGLHGVPSHWRSVHSHVCSTCSAMARSLASSVCDRAAASSHL